MTMSMSALCSVCVCVCVVCDVCSALSRVSWPVQAFMLEMAVRIATRFLARPRLASVQHSNFSHAFLFSSSRPTNAPNAQHAFCPKLTHHPPHRVFCQTHNTIHTPPCSGWPSAPSQDEPTASAKVSCCERKARGFRADEAAERASRAAGQDHVAHGGRGVRLELHHARH
jgi:hypothetical protein